MRRSVSVVITLIPIVIVGCDGPVRFGPPLPAGLAQAAAARQTDEQTSSDSEVHRATSAPEEGLVSDSADPSRMTVERETVSADGIWMNHREELAAKAKALSPAEFRAYLGERSAQLIADKIGEMLLHQRASLRLSPAVERNLDQHVDGEIRKIVTEQHDGIQRRFEIHLESLGLTIADVRAQLLRQLVISGYLEAELRPKVIEPTRAELLAVYEQNVERWSRPARRSMSLIDVRVNDFLPDGVDEPTREQSDAARAEARSKARSARLELQSGAGFADVARRHSHGLHAEEGGKWGWVDPASVRERFVPAIEALGKLDEGEVSDIIEMPDCFFLVRCDELVPAVEPDFQTVQPQLTEQFSRNRYNQLVLEFVAELRRDARIEPANLGDFHAAVAAAALEQAVVQTE